MLRIGIRLRSTRTIRWPGMRSKRPGRPKRRPTRRKRRPKPRPASSPHGPRTATSRRRRKRPSGSSRRTYSRSMPRSRRRRPNIRSRQPTTPQRTMPRTRRSPNTRPRRPRALRWGRTTRTSRPTTRRAKRSSTRSQPPRKPTPSGSCPKCSPWARTFCATPRTSRKDGPARVKAWPRPITVLRYTMANRPSTIRKYVSRKFHCCPRPSTRSASGPRVSDRSFRTVGLMSTRRSSPQTALPQDIRAATPIVPTI